MTVLFVTPHFGNVTNGPDLYAQNLWTLFAEDPSVDFHMGVLTSNVRDPKIHHYGGFQRSRSMYAQLENHIIDILREDVFSGGDVILHVNSAYILSSRLLKKYKTIVQINDTEVAQWKPSLRYLFQHGLRRNLALAWRKKRELSSAMASKKVVCNSHFTRQAVIKHHNLDPMKIVTIYKAIPLAQFLSVRPKRRKPNQEVKLIFIGSNWVRKGLEPLIAAVKQIADTRDNYEIHLHVYGNPSRPVKSRFLKIVKNLNLTDSIGFKGVLTRQEAPMVIGQHNALVIPSFEEALGLAAVEGLAVGIPVIATNVGGLPEVVNTELGYLVPPGEPNSLVDSIDCVAAKTCSDVDIQKRKKSVDRFGLNSLEDGLKRLYLNCKDPMNFPFENAKF
ncbi:glycosyltransferase family 4 protein [Akkermansiaceae bacterium]|nr:glycosyltransferase family 4 protein [Akkermansiaceae bacterium]